MQHAMISKVSTEMRMCCFPNPLTNYFVSFDYLHIHETTKKVNYNLLFLIEQLVGYREDEVVYDREKPMNVLVICLNHLGDILSVWSTLHTLSWSFRKTLTRYSRTLTFKCNVTSRYLEIISKNQKVWKWLQEPHWETLGLKKTR